MPELEALAAEFKGRATLVKLDIDRLFLIDRKVREDFAIGALPLLIVYKDGVEVARLVGADQTGKDQARQALTAAVEQTATGREGESSP